MRAPSWSDALASAVVSGSAASVASTAALAALGEREDGSASAPTNAISHWLWGERATLVDRPTLRNTLVGYLIHHAASIFWATIYEKALAREGQTAGRVVRDAAAISALAAFVDFELTPRRLTPGFERRLSPPALVGVYAAFAVGLAAGRLALAPPLNASGRSSAPRPGTATARRLRRS